MTIIGLLIAIVLICVGSDQFIKGVMALGKRLHWSEFIIGLLIVGLGTSLPEIIISSYSALKGHGNIVVGNIIGSNITNATLVMGLALLVRPIVHSHYFCLSNIVSLVVAIGLFVAGVGLHHFSRGLGIVMLVVAMLSVWFLTRRYASHQVETSPATSISPWYVIILRTLIGLVILLLSAKWIVSLAVALAIQWQISQSFIAMSLIAIGTSLPEIVLAIIASYRGYADLVVGNIVGSNISNVLIGAGLPSVMAPFTITGTHTIMVAGLIVSSLLFLLVTALRILRTRWAGVLLMIFYGLFYILAW